MCFTMVQSSRFCGRERAGLVFFDRSGIVLAMFAWALCIALDWAPEGQAVGLYEGEQSQVN